MIASSARLGASAIEVDADLALARALIERGDLSGAQAAGARALEVAGSLGDPRRHARALELAGTLDHLRHDDASAARHLEAALAQAQRAQLADTSWALSLLDELARAELRDGHVPEALEASKHAVDLARQFGDHHPAYGRALALTGAANLASGRLDKARTKARGSLRIAVETYGETHLDAADAHDLLGAIAHAEHDEATAATELRAALAIRTALAPGADATRATREALDAVLAARP